MRYMLAKPGTIWVALVQRQVWPYFSRRCVSGIEPGVGIEQEHGAEPLDKPENADALLQGTCLADVRGGLDDIDAMPEGQCDRIVGGRVRHDVHVLRRHESGNGRKGVVDDHLFVVGGHENREAGDAEDPALSLLARRARCAAEPAFRGRRRNLSNALSTIRRNPIAAQKVMLMPKTSANISQTGIMRTPPASPVRGVRPYGQGWSGPAEPALSS
ncbi:MAG: hypothetical protein ABSA53_39895 [Streptosporangiaceae bacterium]